MKFISEVFDNLQGASFCPSCVCIQCKVFDGGCTAQTGLCVDISSTGRFRFEIGVAKINLKLWHENPNLHPATVFSNDTGLPARPILDFSLRELKQGVLVQPHHITWWACGEVQLLLTTAFHDCWGNVHPDITYEFNLWKVLPNVAETARCAVCGKKAFEPFGKTHLLWKCPRCKTMNEFKL